MGEETKPEKDVKSQGDFSKGVNDYLNHYVTIADAKAGAILASNFVILGGLTAIKPCGFFSHFLFILAGLTSLTSIFFSCAVIFPRLPRSTKGLIFWENIKQYTQLEEYISDVLKLDTEDIEKEYVKQNWFVSKVLSTKNKKIRVALIVFLVSLFFLVITFFVTKR